MLRTAPRGMRLHISIFGKRNTGKSSLLNALTRQSVSIVSDRAGTTTDPVEKPMELLPLGPVMFIDTAGIDDRGDLGEMRVARTRKVFERTDIGVLVARADAWDDYEEQVLADLERFGSRRVVVFNHADRARPGPELLARLAERGLPHAVTAAPEGRGIEDLREALVEAAPAEFIETPSILGDLVEPGALVVLVVPIDLEAPKGRIILPQVQVIRDLLDQECAALVVKEKGLPAVLAGLREAPALVVTDSQAFAEVERALPPAVPLTSFSILFARFKGDLAEFARGARTLDELREGDRLLVCEACTHHPIEDDIARVKLPRWLRDYTGLNLEIDYVQGHDFPEELGPYRLVIHCGSCVLNRREVLSRILFCRRQQVPITNYGMAIARTLGIFDRALAPFALG